MNACEMCHKMLPSTEDAHRTGNGWLCEECYLDWIEDRHEDGRES